MFCPRSDLREGSLCHTYAGSDVSTTQQSASVCARVCCLERGGVSDDPSLVTRAMRSVPLLLLPAVALCQDAHAAIQSSQGVQHKPPLISDDLIVGCIMIMFLMLFAASWRFTHRTK